MRTVLSIFGNDIKSVSRRFFALAIIVAISALPALYAWVNIYANGNPYGNTGNIKIALASRDPGLTLDDGSHVNMADEIFEEMKTNDKISWQFPGNADDAIESVRSGEYYAAIIFEDNFTYNMYHFEQALLDPKAPLTFYENTKANAVAPKIAETAASNLQESIKTKYLETVFATVFGETNEIADELKDGEAVDTVIGQLENLRDTLRAYNSAINAFTSKSGKIHSGIKDAKKKLNKTEKTASRSANNAGADLRTARNTLEVLEKILENREARIETERAELEALINKITGGGITEEEKEQIKQEAIEKAIILKSDLEGLLSLFSESGDTPAIMAIRAVLESMISDLDTLINSFSDTSALDTINAELKKLSQEHLSVAVGSLVDTIDRTLDLMEPLMASMSSMLGSIDPVLNSADKTVKELDSSLRQMKSVFSASADKIDEIIARVNEASDNDKLDILIDLLGGDPEQYAEFFSSLVDVEVQEVYSVASYGAAMAPFYSVLAIWVGGVVLVSILKTHIDRKKYPDATEAEAFFGRFILFFLIGQIQAAVIVAGDIFLLDCQPAHPWLMWVSAAVTSFVFVLLIYALTISFGDVGKAIVVVIMVLQIAGSSGSYPIEILPPVFSKIYKFFPFPHAINAMREALCGTYAHDFERYLSYLLIFAAAALAIGLLVRKPFLGINNFVSEKLEETEVL